MTILVTGAAGYIGSQIVHQLYRYYGKRPGDRFDQPKIIGVDNLSAGFTCNLPSGFDCLMGDVGNYQFMANLLQRSKVKQIIHCAASVVVPESVAKPLDYYDNNVVSSYHLLRAALAAKVEGFVFSSTAAVYGQPEFPRPLREDDPTRPCSPYGWSKLMTEQMLKDACAAYGMNTVILRYFNVAGADPLGKTGQTSPAATHLITKAVRAVVLRKPMTVYGDGKDVRDYVHVADVAEAHTRALEWTARHNGCLTLNVGSGAGTAVVNVLAAVSRIAHTGVPLTEFARRREGDPLSVVADTRLIRERFNWEPQYGLNEIVEHALKWEKSL
jgi:UDP-glucose 4-epimerase